MVLFEELVEQHRVDCLVAHRVDLSIRTANYQIRVHLRYLLSYQAELWDTIWIKPLLVAEDHGLQSEDGFARLVHWFDGFLESRRGGDRTELADRIHYDLYAVCNR